MSEEQKNTENVEQQSAFRGIVIPITEDNKFGMQLAGDVKLFEVYGVLSLIMEQLRKDIGAK